MKNRILLSLAVILMACPPAFSAGTFKCLVPKTCPKDTPPGKCCDPPPCELFDQIRMKTALQNIFRDKNLREQMVKKSRGDREAAADLLHKDVKAKAAGLGSKLQCAWNGKVKPPPSFETTEDCRINSPTGSMSRETALKTFDTCSEFIEAAYDHENFHKDACFSTNSTERAHATIDQFADEEVAAYQKEIDRLMSDLKSYWRACSPAADAKTARQVAKLGIASLKKAGAKRKAGTN